MEVGQILQALGRGLSALWPFARRRLAERKAGQAPEKSDKSSFDALFAEALERLGALEDDAPLWKRVAVGAQALLVRPESFRKPAVRQWLRVDQVALDLKLEVEARIGRQAPNASSFGRLVEAYMEATGEDVRYAEAAVRIATAFLQASVESATKDPGLASIVQASTSASVREISGRLDAIQDAVSSSTNHYALEQVDAEARTTLQKILKRRASPGVDTVGDLQKLCDEFQIGGRYAGTSGDLQREAQLWLGRMEVASGNVTAGEAVFAEIQRQGQAIPEYVWAMLDLERGDAESAMRRVRGGDDANCRTALFHILRKHRGTTASLQFAESQDLSSPDCFTALGWNNFCVTLALSDRMEDAASHLSRLPASLRSECTHLEYLYAVSRLLPLVPRDRRGALVANGFSSIADHVLEGPQAANDLAIALDAANSAYQIASEAGDTELADRCLMGIRSLKLVGPQSREYERSAIQREMCDPERAVKLIALARMFNIEFDSGALEQHLAKAEALGGLDDDQLRAKLYLLNHPSRAAELVEFLDQYWTRLATTNSVVAMVIMKVQALAQLAELEEAQSFLTSHRSSVSPEVASRLDLMIAAGRGDDAVGRAIELYDKTKAIEDLTNLTQLLVRGRAWRRLLPFAQQLYAREPNFDSAMLVLRCLQHVHASPKEVAEFLESTVAVAEQRSELLVARAWAQLRVGKHESATTLKNQLAELGSSPSLLALEIAIAVQTGDWESLPGITARAWEQRNQLEPSSLLTLARLAGVSNREQALQLAIEAVNQGGSNPAVLIGAHSVAIAAGRDDIGMPWIARAADLSKGDGLIQRFSQRELIEFMKANSESWRKKNDAYRQGQVPVHMAASMFNVPLIQMLTGTVRQNFNEVDPRKRQTVPVRSGKRVPADARRFKCVALDITSLYVLSEFRVLKEAVGDFDEVFISPRLMETLLNERERVAFHQPSRVADVKPLFALVTSERLGVVSGRGAASVAEEVGEESASLLRAASVGGGFYVHPGILYRASSFMEKVAELGELAPLVIDPIDLAASLHDEGRISFVEHAEALAFLQSSGCNARAALAHGAPVYLDGLSIQYLSQSKLLVPLVNSGRRVFVHESTVDEWRALLATEPTRDELVDAIDQIRLVLRQGILDGRVRLLPECRREREHFGGTTLEPLLDLLDDISSVEAVVIDDRMVGGNEHLTDIGNRTVPIICSLDIVDRLARSGSVSTALVTEIRYRLRSGVLFCVPVAVDELNAHLAAARVNGGVIVESAELRSIREYLQRLYSSDVLCTPPDLSFMDEMWRVGLRAIGLQWSAQNCDSDLASARSSWIWKYVVPPFEIAMRFVDERGLRMNEVASARLAASFVCTAHSKKIRSAYFTWLQRAVLKDLIPGNVSVIDSAADQTAGILATRAREIGDELERRSSERVS